MIAYAKWQGAPPRTRSLAACSASCSYPFCEALSRQTRGESMGPSRPWAASTWRPDHDDGSRRSGKARRCHRPRPPGQYDRRRVAGRPCPLSRRQQVQWCNVATGRILEAPEYFRHGWIRITNYVAEANHIDTHIKSSNDRPGNLTGRRREFMRRIIEFAGRNRLQNVPVN